MAFLESGTQQSSSVRSSAGWIDVSGRIVVDFEGNCIQDSASSTLAETRAGADNLQENSERSPIKRPKLEGANAELSPYSSVFGLCGVVCFEHFVFLIRAIVLARPWLQLIQLLCHCRFADVDHPETMEQLRAALEKVDRQLETKLAFIQARTGSEKSAPASQGGKGQGGLPRQPLRKIEQEPPRFFTHDLTVQKRPFQGENSGKDADLVPALMATSDSKASLGLGDWFGLQTPTITDSPASHSHLSRWKGGRATGGGGVQFRRKTNVMQSPVRSGINTPGES